MLQLTLKTLLNPTRQAINMALASLLVFLVHVVAGVEFSYWYLPLYLVLIEAGLVIQVVWYSAKSLLSNGLSHKADITEPLCE